MAGFGVLVQGSLFVFHRRNIRTVINTRTTEQYTRAMERYTRVTKQLSSIVSRIEAFLPARQAAPVYGSF